MDGLQPDLEGGDRGQASIALLATLPAILLIAALLAQAALAGHAIVSASHAARAAARARHIEGSPSRSARAAIPGGMASSLELSDTGRALRATLRVPRLTALGPSLRVGAAVGLPARDARTGGG